MTTESNWRFVKDAPSMSLAEKDALKPAYNEIGMEGRMDGSREGGREGKRERWNEGGRIRGRNVRREY